MGVSPAFVSGLSLATTEGALVSIAIRVEPRDLESLLEALAKVAFPINPQIFHEAEIVFAGSDGREETAIATVVEFPGYQGRLEEVYRALAAEGFDRGAVLVTSMLDELRSPGLAASAKSGWAIRSRHR